MLRGSDRLSEADTGFLGLMQKKKNPNPQSQSFTFPIFFHRNTQPQPSARQWEVSLARSRVDAPSVPLKPARGMGREGRRTAERVVIAGWQQVSGGIGAALGSRPSPLHLGLPREKLRVREQVNSQENYC